MKRALALIVLTVILCGCAAGDECLEQGMALRERMLQAEGCSFVARVTADYGDKTYYFTAQCEVDREGNLKFCVAEPSTIAGIRGSIAANGGKLTFDDTILAFELLADGEISPVSAPWILIKTLRSGYLSSCGMDGDRTRLTIDDSYEEDALRLDIWLGLDDLPQCAEILWQGRRILSLEVEDFVFV